MSTAINLLCQTQLMDVDQVLADVQQVLLRRQLSPVERLILRQSCLGQTYTEIAESSTYGSAHLKEIGSQLWHDLSVALGRRVTKRNLHFVLNQYQQNRTSQLNRKARQEFQTDTGAANDIPGLIPQTKMAFPGGPLPLKSPLYINRSPIEELTCTKISQPGCVINIKAPSKMGKSSLLQRIIDRGEALGYKTVYLDFRQADEAVFGSLDKFLRWFCANVSRQLHLNPMLNEYWDADMGSKVSCKIYFEGYVLEQINTPIVLALNEVNRVFEHPGIAQEFLPMLRAWHEQAQQEETWQKLRLVVVYTTEVYIPLKLNQSPFNVGLSIKLPQFTSEQVQDLALRYGLDWMDGSQTQQLMAMVGGHPYLVSLALYYLVKPSSLQWGGLQELLQAAPTAAGIYSDHLRGHLATLLQEPELVSAMQQVVSADQSVLLEAIAAYKLESMGLVQLDGNWAKPSCQLYRLYFRSQLEHQSVQQHLGCSVQRCI